MPLIPGFGSSCPRSQHLGIHPAHLAEWFVREVLATIPADADLPVAGLAMSGAGVPLLDRAWDVGTVQTMLGMERRAN
jgi:hypothetical protein